MVVVLTPQQMAAKLQALHTDELPALVEAMGDACLNIEGKAKDDCTPGKSRYYRAPYSDDNDPHRQPPHMRDTIEGKVVEVTATSVRGQVGTPKSYSAAVHEGTTKKSMLGGRIDVMQARPFISDNIADEAETTLEILSEATRQVVRRQCI